jgi:hypothetical protein
VSPFITSVIDRLVERHGHTQRVDLNDIAEVIGMQAVSYDDVDLIIATLEARGCDVGGPPTAREMLLLSTVLDAARPLQSELGRHPSVEEIAARSGQPAFVVRRALENARSLANAAG